MEKIAIAGSGPAGWTAAVYAARAGLDPLVIEGLQPGGQLTTTTEVENYPGFPEAIDGTALVENMKRQALRFGARALSGDVIACDFSGRPLLLKLSDGNTVETLTCIVATGASANYLGLESERALIGRGVSGCATCDGAFYRDRAVAVVGGGDTAMEDALYLSRIAEKVTIVHRRDVFRASRIMAERVLAHPKIETLWDTVVEEVLDVARNEVTGLRLRNKKNERVFEIAVAGVFVAIGHTPNTEPFRAALEVDARGFVTVRRAHTSVPGVFAAGDVQDPVYRQAVTAAGSGCAAALEAQRYLEAQGL
jgi:thioredoxin reductase (NADPH)